MSPEDQPTTCLPSVQQFRRAVEIFIEHAYGDRPGGVERFLPPPDVDLANWLEGPSIERDPPRAKGSEVRSYTLRIGNAVYPHMKLRLSRPENGGCYMFSVDSHDAFLSAPPGTDDHAALEQLKGHNAEVARAIRAAWDAEGLPSERSLLREKIIQARRRQEAQAPGRQDCDEPCD